jgi:hypothetical protein
VLKAVVYRQILYPLTYANTNSFEINKLKTKIQTVMRAKMRIPQQVSNDVLYMHEDMGGLGQDSIEDLINTDRLITLVMCLQDKGQMRKIINGAINRLKLQAKILSNPLVTEITEFMAPQQNTWLYNLKLWMEAKGIKVRQNHNGSLKEGSCSIMDMYKRKTQRREIWQFLERKHLKHIEDIMHSDGTMREEIWIDESATLQSSIIPQVIKMTRIHAQSKWPIYKPFEPSRWVMKGNRIGQIQSKHKQILTVMEWKVVDRKYKAYKHKKWKITNVCEVKIRLSENNKEIVDANPIDSSDSEEEIEENDVRNRKEENVGLWDLTPGEEQYLELMDRATDPQEQLRGVSDGSVKDNQQGGTFAWAIIKEKVQHGLQPMEYVPTGVEAYGREDLPITKLPTEEAHSYRMEALGLLSALKFLRTEIQWTGTLDWHIDSMSVIKTFGKCHHLNNTKWQRQRDKDIWIALIEEKKTLEG